MIGTTVCFRNHKICRNNRKLLHVVCETIRRKKLLTFSNLYKVKHVEGWTWITCTNYHAYDDLIKFWKYVFPTMFKYRGNIAKTGDKSSLRCFFQSNTNTTVVKISKWNLIYMHVIKSKCAWHLFCEVRHRSSRVMPLFWNCYIRIKKFCVLNFFNSSVIFMFFVVFWNSKLTNSPYERLLCDITTDILVAKK